MVREWTPAPPHQSPDDVPESLGETTTAVVLELSPISQHYIARNFNP